MFRFEDLQIWQLSIAYAEDVYNLSDKLPGHEKFNLIGQLKRAALSVSNNIAEGSGTVTIKNFKSFLDISISSVLETVNILHFAKKRGYITETERFSLYQKAETLVKKIRAFKNSLK